VYVRVCVYYGFELMVIVFVDFELMGTAAESFGEPKSIWVMEKSTDCEETCGQSRPQEDIFWKRM
jgi:hypothetical protein